MRAATEGHLPPDMPQRNLIEILRREVRQGSPGELMVKSSPSRQRRPPCKTSKAMSDEAADAAALTYLLTYSPQRDDRHHRRSRSRSPVSPGYAGELLAEREERRLAEAAMPVGPQAGQSRAASAHTGPSTWGHAPAEETAPAAQAGSSAAPPPEGALGGQGAETPAQQAAPPPRPRPPARRQPRPRPPDPNPNPNRQRGGRPWRGPQAPRREPPQPQRWAGRVRKGPRPRPWRAAPPHRPATPRPQAHRGRGGRTPHAPRAPRRGPPQPRRRAGRASSTAPTPTPATSTPAPPSRTPPRPPFPRRGRGTSAPRCPSVHRQASRRRSCRGNRTPGA